MKLPELAPAVAALLLSATVTRSEPVADVVTIGGSITEIAYALGQGHRGPAQTSCILGLAPGVARGDLLPARERYRE